MTDTTPFYNITPALAEAMLRKAGVPGWRIVTHRDEDGTHWLIYARWTSGVDAELIAESHEHLGLAAVDAVVAWCRIQAREPVLTGMKP